MKTKTLLLAAVLAIALPCLSFAVTQPYMEEVSVTATSATSTFGFKPAVVEIFNDGANEIFVHWEATAVADGTHDIKIPANSGKRWHFAPGKGPASVGIVCSAAETATARVEAYQYDGQVSTFPVEQTVVDVNPPATILSTITADDLTLTDDASVGDDLAVTGLATVGETLAVTGNATMGGTMAITGNTTVGGTLGVTGVTTMTAQPIVSSLTASRLVVSDASKGLASNGAITTNAVPKSASSGASLSASSISDDGTTVATTEKLSVTGASVTGKLYIATPQAESTPDSGDGNPAADTLVPTASVVLWTCSDADGCAITMDETGAVSGEIVHIINMSANAITFADTAGLSETSGSLSLGQYDAVSFIYATDRFVQLAAVENN